MLKIVNQYWEFPTEEELNKFLDSCMTDTCNEFQVERYGRAKSGKFYAYGSVIPTAKFTKNVAEKGETVAKELNLG